MLNDEDEIRKGRIGFYVEYDESQRNAKRVAASLNSSGLI